MATKYPAFPHPVKLTSRVKRWRLSALQAWEGVPFEERIDPQGDVYLSATEVAKRYQVNPQTVTRWVREGAK